MLMSLWLWLLSRLGFDPRGLFVYHDGRRWRRGDPLDIARRLFAAPGFDWDETPKLLLTGRADIQLEAFAAISIAVRGAFGIPIVAIGGLTEAECLDLLTRFREYLGDVKKNGSLFPISPDSTAAESLDDCLTRPASASGSTPAGPSIAPHGSPVEPTSGGSAMSPAGP